MDYLMIWSVLAAGGAFSSAMMLVAAERHGAHACPGVAGGERLRAVVGSGGRVLLLGGCGVSEGTPPPVANDTEALARVVLRTVNRTQVKGSSVRLVVLRAPEVVHEVGVGLTASRIVEVEEYLHLHGYVVPVNMGLSWGTYTITPAGFEWLGGGTPGPPPSTERVLELAERPGEEVALEAALRAELEEEQKRMEEFERELEEEGRREGPPRASGRAAEEPRGTEEPTRPEVAFGRLLSAAGGSSGDELRSWWRRVFGG